MRVFELTTRISSTPERIWQALITFDRYHEWNSIVPQAAGTSAPGSRLDLVLKQHNGRLMSFRPQVVDVTPNHALSLAASVLHPGLVHMRHHFILHPVQRKITDLVQRWECTGLLVPLLWKQLVAGMQPFAMFGNDLKQVLETD